MAPTPTSRSNALLRRDAGVTLVEMMIAVLIVSLAAGLVMLAAPGPERQMRAFVERFAAIVARGAEESVIANKPVALIVTDAGFGFQRREGEMWMDMAPGSPLGFRAWPDGVRYDAAPSRDDGRVTTFDVLGAATPTELRLIKDGALWRVRIESDGGVDVARLD
jgi:type II secretion system protein H